MGRLKFDFWGAAFIVGLQKTCSTQAPAVTRLETNKVIFWPGRAEIISHIFGIGKKLFGHHRAYGVTALIFGACVAKPIAEKPADW